MQRMMRYEVKPDGGLGPGCLFTQGPGIGDGMKVDTRGNVYSTSGAGPGIVRITAPRERCSATSTCRSSAASPSGRSARPTWRSATDAKSLYVTACDVVYRIRMKVAGVMQGPRPAP